VLQGCSRSRGRYEMVLSLLRGLIIGFVCGIPVGPVNAAVIDTALRKCFRRALCIGFGGAFVDFAYSQIAAEGLGTLMAKVPGLTTTFMIVGGAVLVVFGIMTVKAPPVPPPEHHVPPATKHALVAAFGTGVLMTVANPAALVSWVLLAGTV